MESNKKNVQLLIKKVSHERILEEVNKILLSENPDYIRKIARVRIAAIYNAGT